MRDEKAADPSQGAKLTERRGYFRKKIDEAQWSFDKAKEAEAKARGAVEAGSRAAASACGKISKAVEAGVDRFRLGLVLHFAKKKPWRALGLGAFARACPWKFLRFYALWVPRLALLWAGLAMSWRVALVNYLGLVLLDVCLDAWTRATQETAALDELCRWSPRLIGVELQESVTLRSHEGVGYPGPRGQAWHGSLPMDVSVFGKLAGARLVGFCKNTNEDMPQIALGFQPGRSGSFVAPFAVFEDKALYALRRFLAFMAEELKALSAPMEALAPLLFAWEGCVKKRAAMERRLETARQMESEWGSVALPDATLESILKTIDMLSGGSDLSPKGLILHGPPGTGKTALARHVRKTAGCAMIEAGWADLAGSDAGSAAIKVKEVWEKARAQAPCILFIDECEGVFGRRSPASSGSLGDELAREFLSQWDGMGERPEKVLVMGATNRKEWIDEAVMSRFASSVLIGLPDEKARARILKLEFDKAKITFLDEDGAVSRASAGMSGRELSQMAALSASEAYGGQVSSELALAEIKRMRGKSAGIISEAAWDGLELSEAVKMECVLLGKELRNSEKLRRVNIRVPASALLWGPPGAGKARIARVVANESGLSFVAASADSVKLSRPGLSGESVRAIFERARSRAPCMLFIDKIERMAPCGGSDSEMLRELLEELDEASSAPGGVFVMASSDQPDLIDPDVLSRLERGLEVALPDQERRAAIAEKLLRGKPLAFGLQEGARLLALGCPGFSEGDLSAVVESASRAAVKRALAESDVVGDGLKMNAQDLQDAIVSRSSSK